MSISHTPKLAINLYRISVLSLLLLGSVSPAMAQVPDQTGSLTEARMQARDALNQGVAAFRSGQYEEAQHYFARAKELDPRSVYARLYLATTYASQFIPGAPSEENISKGKLATDEYKEVLQMDSRNLSAIDGLASMLYQRAGQPFSPEMFAESKSYYQKHVELRPNDPAPYYSIGVINWALSYHANSKLRQEFNASLGDGGLRDTDPLPEVLRSEYVQKYGPLVNEGIDSLNRAIALKPDYDDAMVYLNLLYRQKADMAATPAEREQYMHEADDLLDRVKEIKEKTMHSPQ